MFKNILSHKGRIRRTEYGLSYLVYILIINGLDLFVQFSGIPFTEYIQIAIIIPIIYIFIVQGIKRCHDRGNNGWFQIIPFYQLWMLFADSYPEPNDYGDNPKGIGNYDNIDDIGKQIENE